MATYPENEGRPYGAKESEMHTDTDRDDVPAENEPVPADAPTDEFDDMSEDAFETFLTDALDDYADDNDVPLRSVATFDEAGVLTRNKGLVVRIGGAEFQITIVRSR